jgi:hypothetical protein
LKQWGNDAEIERRQRRRERARKSLPPCEKRRFIGSPQERRREKFLFLKESKKQQENKPNCYKKKPGHQSQHTANLGLKQRIRRDLGNREVKPEIAPLSMSEDNTEQTKQDSSLTKQDGSDEKKVCVFSFICSFPFFPYRWLNR